MSSVQVELNNKQVSFNNPFYSISSDTNIPRSNEEAADTENVVTISAATDEKIHITFIDVVIEGGTPGADMAITIEEQGTVRYKSYIGSDTSSSRIGESQELEFGLGQDVTITVAAGGPGINSVINYAYHIHS